MPTPSEDDLQKALVIWLDGNPDRDGVPRRTPALRPGVVYWHTPNGGQRSAREGANFKKMGVKAGIHDLLFLWGGLYGLELKEPGGNGRLSRAQELMHPRLLAAGMIASAVIDNLAEAKAWIIRHGLAIDC